MKKFSISDVYMFQPKAENHTHQLNSIHKAYGEEGFEDASGFEDFVDGGTTDSGGFDMGGGDFGADGGFGTEEGQDGNLPKDALEFLENIDEDENPLVQKVMDNFATLYRDQSKVYNRLILENLDTTEYAEQVKELKKQFSLTLELLKEYLVNKFRVETTAVRVSTFIDFKFSFQKLNDALDLIITGIS